MGCPKSKTTMNFPFGACEARVSQIALQRSGREGQRGHDGNHKDLFLQVFHDSSPALTPAKSSFMSWGHFASKKA
jgi:hypothetical protein